MDLVFDLHIPRAGMHRRPERLMALLFQEKAEDAQNKEYPAIAANRNRPHHRFSAVDLCRSAGTRRGSGRRDFLLPMFRTGIVK